MPFNSETGAAGGRKGGRNRWKDKDPDTVRNKQLKISLTLDEFQAVEDVASRLGLSKAELVITSVKAYGGLGEA